MRDMLTLCRKAHSDEEQSCSIKLRVIYHARNAVNIMHFRTVILCCYAGGGGGLSLLVILFGELSFVSHC